MQTLFCREIQNNLFIENVWDELSLVSKIMLYNLWMLITNFVNLSCYVHLHNFSDYKYKVNHIRFNLGKECTWNFNNL